MSKFSHGKEESALSIGQLSLQSGCKVPTIRFYEQKGLLPAPQRTEGGQRRYSSEDLLRLRFICHARELGFDLAKIEQLLALSHRKAASQTGKAARLRRKLRTDGELRVNSEAPSEPHADELVLAHLDEVKGKIIRLQSLQSELERMLERCDPSQPSCLVIEALSDHALCSENHR
ncbi:MAG: MerR family transcriptional regulator [Pseudomonadales bacterium]